MANGHFWHGPIRTRARAESIINVAGWVFVAFGALGLVSMFGAASGGPARLAASLITALLFAAPGGFLLKTKGRAPAAILLGVSVFSTAVSLIVPIAMLSKGAPGGFLMILLPLFWAMLATLCWRAFEAAGALRSLPAAAEALSVHDGSAAPPPT